MALLNILAVIAVALLFWITILLRRLIFLVRMNTEITAQAGGLGALAFGDARLRMRTEDESGNPYR